MTQFEKAEIRRLPKKYRPMGAWGYFWHNILYAIPVLGWICLIWGAVSDKNISRRSYARLGCWVLLIALAAVGAVMYLALNNSQMLIDLLDKLKGLIPAAK
ncbi:MAG: hypothetical protein IJD79_03800 [Clostridia bacterium]|nr:hypothetical protein [Clostridia bacterium]